jgi:hypothetical protein
VGVSQRKRQRPRVCVCDSKEETAALCVCVTQRKRQRPCVCVWLKGRDSGLVCVCDSKEEAAALCVCDSKEETAALCVCVTQRKRQRPCVCVTQRKRQRHSLLQACSQRHNLKKSAWYLPTFRDSVITTATRYWTVRGSNPGAGRVFPCPSRSDPRPPTPASGTMGTRSFQGVKRPGPCANQPPPPIADVANGLSRYFRLPPCLHRNVTRWPISIPTYIGILMLLLTLLHYNHYNHSSLIQFSYSAILLSDSHQ